MTEALSDEAVDEQARQQLRRFPEEVIYRAVQYLYVKETMSSYEIEHLNYFNGNTLKSITTIAKTSEPALEKPSVRVVGSVQALPGFRMELVSGSVDLKNQPSRACSDSDLFVKSHRS